MRFSKLILNELTHSLPAAFCFMLLLCSCNKKTNETVITLPSGISTPFWYNSDLGINQYAVNGKVTHCTITQQIKPSFYVGKMPLIFDAAYPPPGAYGSPDRANSIDNMSEKELVLYYAFSNFINYFIFHGNSICGAQTQSNGIVLAEAKITEVKINANGPTCVIEEVHYNGEGKPVFFCKGVLNWVGSKTNEYDVLGTKDHEYYFQWPDFRYIN